MKAVKNKVIAAFPTQSTTVLVAVLALLGGATAKASPVPGYVPPVTMATTPEYADDTRGVYVPTHEQYRLHTERELQNWGRGGNETVARENDGYERHLNQLSNGTGNMGQELQRIAQDPGVLRGGQGTSDAFQYEPQRLAQGYGAQPRYSQKQAYGEYPAAMQQGQPVVPMPAQAPYTEPMTVPLKDGGVEIASGNAIGPAVLDMHNSLVRLKEDRVSIRRALQRMMDQIGGGDWTVVWDLDEQNAGLPEMEISVYAEEPFMNVLNALLARVQTRSGQPLRVIRYDQTRRLVITDRSSGYRLAGNTSSVGVEDPEKLAVTERVLKEAMVSLHYDEVPLVDALENIVAQAGKGQWRLRMYAGRDQVLKPAHIEEPFNVAMERLLKLFNLKYEIFPGGKLIVVTHSSKFGFKGM